ncbi:MBL fold metallo-hydrolase [Aquibacillus koreensis]|uniref:MBL fold metallo-hydrolase n=1 Tax=Aquibacillus koreensis TaxID=279446 RepID=A0A9X3WLT4_9BACI|nr:MBL fold metallo-hydrolase [Aquibacillus koreensis]MCT2536120.1 MBL fold metallo-hydrolase [Aquibacillus koreensis]MDC3422045.1 MBL fold metallo-hydrolase [Aquibacillus koreensis]
MDKYEEQSHIDKDLDMDHAEAEAVYEDVAFYRTLLVNVIMLGKPESDDWLLIDAGIAHYGKRIIAAAEKRYGNKPPRAIILTHGHFDHVGSAKELAKFWDVPIYAHEQELDFITDKQVYPPADPTVGGGMFSLLSPIFPQRPVNLKKWAKALPDDGSIPFLDEWKYIHTPGHTPGHISLFREKDKTLLSGDAIVTENPESSFAVFFPLKKVYGPPAYFTQDWDLAEESVKKIVDLEPNVVVAGHGLPMEGEQLRKQLRELSSNFLTEAIPKNKRH